MNKIDGDETIGRYLRAIGSIPLLTQEETLELVARIKKGDKEAKEKLIRSNLKLVVHIAKKYVSRSGLAFEDLIQAGNYGLLKAVGRKGFNSKKGCRFSSYAGQAIENTIARAIFDCSKTVRVPDYIQTRIQKIFRAENCLWQKNGSQTYFPDLISEVSKDAGLTKRETKNALGYCYKFISLQQPRWSDGNDTFEEFIDEGGNLTKFSNNFESRFNPEIYRRLNQEELKKIFDDALKILPPKEKLVVRSHFGLNGQQKRTLAEIGKKLGVSREYVRQIKEKALKKLRKCPQIRYLAKQ